ncbi:Aminopeptidase 2 [Yarrowia sp. E02]|nr:Aminopeptidase 2 [Yarrowia sp. E02]
MARDTLPSSLKPTNYNLSVYDIDIDQFLFKGRVVIKFDVNEATKSIDLNAKDLKLDSVEVKADVTKTEVAIDVDSIDYNEKNDTVAIALKSEIPANASSVTATILYSGVIQQNMSGFYKSSYKDPEGNDKIQLSTQFEATDARAAFPCMDEPNLKATFDVSITVPEAWEVISNMPVVASKAPTDGKKGASKGPTKGPSKGPADGADAATKTVTFDTTPKMSTYLLAWACGEFEYVEDFTERSYNGRKLPVRVYTTKGLKEQGLFALDVTKKVIDLFSDVFEIDYMLPKMDLLACHEFSHGAMENWGLITYRTTAVLFDEKTSAAAYKQRVAYVVAHEVAHQWFGDLVTMDWWDELWLNEGFATWVGWYAVDRIFPDWHVFTAFVAENMEDALQLDSVRASHPIEVPVTSAKDIDQIFDAISYLKGASTIRMLGNTLGVDTFLKGVAAYLKKHSYGNAHTADLWSAISEVSGRDVNTLMESWIKKIGYPVITVTENEGSTATLKQNRFLTTGDAKPDEDETLWWVPLEVTSAGPGEEASGNSDSFDVRETSIAGVAHNGFFKLNRNRTGFYRCNYSVARLESFGQHLDKLSSEDRVGIISDALATSIAGYASTVGLLSFLSQLSGEEDPVVWTSILDALATIRSAWFEQSEETQKAIDAFTAKLIEPIISKIGLEFTDKDNFLDSQLRTRLLGTAAGLGVDAVSSHLTALFDKWAAGDKTAIHPSIRIPVFRAAVSQSDDAKSAAAFDALLKELENPSSVDSIEIVLSSLGAVQSPALITKSVDMLLTIAPMNLHFLGGSLVNNKKARWAQWEFIKANWDNGVVSKLGANMVVLERYLKLSLRQFASQKALDDVEEFFVGKDLDGFDRSLGQAKDFIKSRAAWVERDGAVVGEWLAKHE